LIRSWPPSTSKEAIAAKQNPILQTNCRRARQLVPCGEWQQGDVPGLLDGTGQASLVGGANASEPPGHNLAAFGHKPLQQPDIAIRDRIDLLGTELADFFAAEELSATAGSA
jgi:hypothetical protein